MGGLEMMEVNRKIQDGASRNFQDGGMSGGTSRGNRRRGDGPGETGANHRVHPFLCCGGTWRPVNPCSCGGKSSVGGRP